MALLRTFFADFQFKAIRQTNYYFAKRARKAVRDRKTRNSNSMERSSSFDDFTSDVMNSISAFKVSQNLLFFTKNLKRPTTLGHRRAMILIRYKKLKMIGKKMRDLRQVRIRLRSVTKKLTTYSTCPVGLSIQ